MAAQNLPHRLMLSSSIKQLAILLFLSILGTQVAASHLSLGFTEITSSNMMNQLRIFGKKSTASNNGGSFLSWSSIMKQRGRLYPRSSCSAMAFCNVHTIRRNPSLLRNYPRQQAFAAITSSALSSSSSDNYYAAASSISRLSTATTQNETFPSWWPVSKSMSKYVTFSDHIAHVIIPDPTTVDNDGTSGNSDQIYEGMTCGQLIEWVLRLRAARNRNEKIEIGLDGDVDAIITTTTIDKKIKRRHETIIDEYQQGQSVSTTTTILDPAYRHDPNSFPQLTHYANNLTSAELLAMGSIWSLPFSASQSKSSNNKSTSIDRFDPSSGVKPIRLDMGNYNDIVSSGDYFRVHFNPRRFVDTNKYDWIGKDGIIREDDGKPGVIVKRDDEVGYMIINKPPNIPVHARVDNLLENVASSVGRVLWLERREEILSNYSSITASSISSDAGNDEDEADMYWPSGQRKKKKKSNRKQKSDKLVYVATPQRLDQNTSGLLIVATKKSFASYFAKLLRTKTSGQLRSGGSSQSSCGVHKSYRCLVCVTPNQHNVTSAATSSMASEVERLKRFENEGTIIKHFLEPSIRAPKRFVESVPEDAESPESWAECLLKITRVANVCTVVGNSPSDALAQDLWGEFGKPNDCVGVAELEIELLTGRTHQIRGQMAALGLPLVGDVQYGGAVPNTSSEYMKNCRGRAEGFLDSETLALQCSTLEFLGPEVPDESEKVQRSDRWLSYHLEAAFWTPFVRRYYADGASLSDSALTLEGITLSEEKTSEQPPIQLTDVLDLPPLIKLSPGSNKYVVIRATDMANVDNELWFVRSASPEQCGGPYHANVAKELLNSLQSLGFSASVMGGGRIDFLENDEVAHAHVFGFSYGFGKGDHEKVAQLIEENTDIIATFDMSDGLY